MKFCRILLGVGSKSPAPAVLGECGRHSIYVLCYVKCIKFWLKLLSMEEGTLLRSCYEMLVIQNNAGRKNWVSDIKDLLYRYGFGYIWEMQHVENANLFIYEFKMRLLDSNIQNWRENMSAMPKLRTLCLYKNELTSEPYLTQLMPRRMRTSLAKFRIGNHDLAIEVGRHHNIIATERYCKLCLSIQKMTVEDEYHVLMECQFYDELRNKYPCLQKSLKNLYAFTSIMSSTQSDIQIQLGYYIANMFKLRRILQAELDI